MKKSKRGKNTRPPYRLPEKSVCRSRSKSKNWTWNNRLVSNWERSTSRLDIVTLFKLCAGCIMWYARLDEAQVWIKIAGRTINSLRYASNSSNNTREDATHGHHQTVNTKIRHYIISCQRRRCSILPAKTISAADCGSDHELLIAKYRFKLKKEGKTTRPFMYDLNQIIYTVEVTKRFKG